MSLPAFVAQDLVPDPAFLLGDVVDRLKHTITDRPLDRDGMALIEKMMAFATTAERQISAQRQRIAQLESLSMTDELTGLANRRGFRDFLNRSLAGAARHGETGVLAYFDLDDFKAVNDRFGHEAGDAALRHVGDLLARGVRRSDFVARLHGDEFAVLLLRTTPVNGEARLRRLRQTINDTPLLYGERVLHVATSLGVTGFEPGVDASELLRRADHAMYQEKRGRPSSRRAAAAE